jgi:hypothetical protein
MTVCPKCGSSNTYEIGRDHGCRMCGKQFPKEGATPIIILKERKKDMPEEVKKYPSGKKGICVNCRRERFISDAAGLCGMCHAAVKGLDPDDIAYADALKKAKARSINTGAALVRSTQTAKDRKVVTRKPKKPVLDHTIKQIARAGLAGIPSIIAQARAERDGYLAEAAKLNKAINILESL